jgi:hypothetical protein
MALVVDPWHWLTPDAKVPPEHPQLRRNILRVARVIEYGSTVPMGEFRKTLIECSRRSKGKVCPGLLWVMKATPDTIVAFCPVCETDHIAVSNWQGTPWAKGLAPATSTPPSSEDAVF